MDKSRKKPTAFLVFVITLLFVLVFASGIYLINYLLYPRLLDVWKTYLFSIAGSLGISLAILSGLAQITGYSIKDMFSHPIPGNPEKEDKLMQEGKKRQRTTNHSDEIIRIIDEIQSALYSDNNRLPIVLTKCLALAELANLPQADKEWLSRELNGYQYLAEQDGEGKYLKDGVESSANHRVIEPYFKVQYVDAETRIPDIMTLPIPKVFIPYPIAQLIEEIQDAKENNLNEISYPLVKVDKRAFLQVRQFVYEHFHGAQMPGDLRAFIKISDYEDILNKVRQKVLNFINQARRKI